jgi:hypothetical protein
VQFSEWLTNVVMVLKKNGKWRICIDFTNLNKACPNDDYPLPRINTLLRHSMKLNPKKYVFGVRR